MLPHPIFQISLALFTVLSYGLLGMLIWSNLFSPWAYLQIGVAFSVNQTINRLLADGQEKGLTKTTTKK